MTDSLLIPPFHWREHVLDLWLGAQAWDTSMTVLMGVLVAAVCGWIGCYLILQGLALLGDAISHTVLLGIVVVVLLGGGTGGLPMLIGAAVTGLVTTLLIETLHGTSRIKEDAAVGIVFTGLFALGVALLGMFAARSHIDSGHVLFGSLELVANPPLVHWGRLAVPVPVFRMALLSLLVLGLIVACFKELLVVSFDPGLAASLGLRPRVVRYLMMAVLSVVVVGAFESVGAILVVAMLIAPAATAYLLTRRLAVMLPLSTVAGCLSAVLGFHLSYWLDVSTAGAMVTVACGLFGLAFLFAPQQGLLAAEVRQFRLRLRTRQENIVRHLLKAGGLEAAASVASVATALGSAHLTTRWAVLALRQRGWIEASPGNAGEIRLTRRGRLQAERLDRAHRLWETYLVEQVGIASDHVHSTAEEIEHVLSDQLVESVDDALGHPSTDPHGAPIPRSPVADRGPGVFQLSKLRVGDCARLVGLAESSAGLAAALSEPDQSARAVVELGLTLGERVEIVDRTLQPPAWTVRLADAQTRVVSHDLADLILVQRIDSPAADAPT